MANPELVALATRYRAAVAANDADAIRRLTQAYGRMYQRLQVQLEALVAEIADKQPSRGQVTKLVRYRQLMEQLEAELTQYQQFAAVELDAVSDSAAALASEHAAQLASVAASGNTRLAAQFNRLNPNAITQALGFTQADGPLYARLRMLAPTVAERVANTLVDSIGLGRNPRVIARLVREDLGIGLTDAVRMTRTLNLYTYREASRANYAANSDLVPGWYWFARLNDATCVSCISLHGTYFPNSERLNDHHNGHCIPIPAIRGFPSPIEQSGTDWFEQLPEDVQRKRMGNKRWDELKAGRLTYADMVGTYDDPVYGPMRRVRSLKELLGDD